MPQRMISDSPKPLWWHQLTMWADRYREREGAFKDALREIRSECTSGYPEMAAVDEAWTALFGDSADAPWKSCSSCGSSRRRWRRQASR